MADPLAIVQARMGSTRLPGKMLLDLGGKPLIWWAWNAAVEAFGADNVVVAMPANAENDELAEVVERFTVPPGIPQLIIKGRNTANVFRWDGPEHDVLGRFHVCAYQYRWHPESVIVRVTPDDPFKDPKLMRRVANGERHPVELGGEAYTLYMLNEANEAMSDNAPEREHLGLLYFPPPPPPPGVWTIDTQADLDAARARIVGLQTFDYVGHGEHTA